MNTKALTDTSCVCSQYLYLHVFNAVKVFGLSYVAFHSLIDLVRL